MKNYMAEISSKVYEDCIYPLAGQNVLSRLSWTVEFNWACLEALSIFTYLRIYLFVVTYRIKYWTLSVWENLKCHSWPYTFNSGIRHSQNVLLATFLKYSCVNVKCILKIMFAERFILRPYSGKYVHKWILMKGITICIRVLSFTFPAFRTSKRLYNKKNKTKMPCDLTVV